MSCTGETLFLGIGLIIMLFFAFYFFTNRSQNKYFSTAALVTAITTFSYLLMLEGSYVVLSVSGEFIYYTRWIFYIASCSLLMTTIADFLKLKDKNLISVLVLNSLVMLTGAFAAVTVSPMKFIIFALSVVFYLWLIAILFEGKKSKDHKKLIMIYIILGWSLFPIVFLIAPEGFDIINSSTAIILYLLLDIFTKIVFYFHLSSKK